MPGLPVPIINDVTLAPPEGQLTVEGHAPSVAISVEAPTAAITVTGHAPAVAISEAGAPPPGEIAVEGHAPDIRLTVEPFPGQVTVEGHPPTLSTPTQPEPPARGRVWTPPPRKDVTARVTLEGRIYVVALNPLLTVTSTYEEELVLALA